MWILCDDRTCSSNVSSNTAIKGSTCHESPLSGNATAYSPITPYAWLSYQIPIPDIIWMNWHQNFIRRFVFLCTASLLSYEIKLPCVLNFEGHILTFSKNASEIVLPSVATYIRVIVKHNTSFRIVWLSILHTNYKNDNFQYKKLLPPTFIYSTISLRDIHHIWTNKDINEDLESV